MYMKSSLHLHMFVVVLQERFQEREWKNERQNNFLIWVSFNGDEDNRVL
ncbi:hypothetical protein V6Z12_A08G145300 [Gossypium hirsutum]